MPMFPEGPNNASVRKRNKEAVRRVLEAFNTGDTSMVDANVSRDTVSRSPHPFPAPPGEHADRLKREIEHIRSAFPDLHLEAEVLIAEGDLVFVGWRQTGSHQGRLISAEPSGRQVNVFGGEILRLRDGMVVEHMDHFLKPRLELLSQLGVLTQDLQEDLRRRGLIP